MTSPAGRAATRTERAVLDGLLRAVAAVRQHPAGHRLRDDAVSVFAARAAAAAAGDDVRLPLQAEAERPAPNDPSPPSGAGTVRDELLAAGVSAVVLERGVVPAALTELAVALGEFRADDLRSHGGDVAAAVLELGLSGVRLEATRRAGGPASARPHGLSPWPLLPSPPAGGALPFRAAIERELGANLQALAAAALLQDLTTPEPPERDGATSAILEGLMASMLRRHDAAGAAWLVEATRHHPILARDAAFRVRERALAALRTELLRLSLATPEEALGLVALALQLDGDGVRELLQAASACGAELPPAVRALLPGGA